MDYRSPAALRKAELSALQKELEIIGAVYFLRQFEVGTGNDTEDREPLLADISLDAIVKSHIDEWTSLFGSFSRNLAKITTSIQFLIKRRALSLLIAVKKT